MATNTKLRTTLDALTRLIDDLSNTGLDLRLLKEKLDLLLEDSRLEDSLENEALELLQTRLGLLDLKSIQSLVNTLEGLDSDLDCPLLSLALPAN